MKTFQYIFLLLLLMVATGCRNEDHPSPIQEGTLYDVAFSFNISISSTTQTRGRIFDTTDCLQQATDMRIYIFRSESGEEETFTLYEPDETLMKPEETEAVPHLYVSAFDNDNKPGIDLKETHKYGIEQKLPEGYYRFLAVGRDDNPAESDLKLNWEAGKTKWEEAIITNSSQNPRVAEIFSGYAANEKGEVETIHVAGSGGFLCHITLHRAVAGVFLYVKNVPEKAASEFDWPGITKGSEANVTEVAVVAMGHDKELNLVSRKRRGIFTPDPTAASGLLRLASIIVGEGGEDYKRPNSKGEFIFPVDLSSSENNLISSSLIGAAEQPVSLALCFYSGEYPVKLLPIKMARTETVHTDVNGVEDDSPEDESGRRYNLVANHLYCLGNKDKDMDNPVDLEEALKDHTLEITVIGAWQEIVKIEMD